MYHNYGGIFVLDDERNVFVRSHTPLSKVCGGELSVLVLLDSMLIERIYRDINVDGACECRRRRARFNICSSDLPNPRGWMAVLLLR